MGPVEGGVRTTFVELGILEPTTAYECLAIYLAQILDGTNPVYKAVQDKAGVSSISNQLVKTMEKVEQAAESHTEDTDEIADRY